MANAGIYAQFARPVRSMQDYASDYDAAEQNALTLAAKRMEMQRAQAGMQDQERIRGLASQYGGDENALIKALRGGGYFEQAGGLEKQIAERLKAQADLGQVGANTKNTLSQVEERAYKLAKQKDDDVNMALGALAGDPALSLGKVTGVLQGLVNSGRITPKYMEDALRDMPDDPNVIRGDLLLKVRKQLQPKELIELYAPKIEYKDSGQQLIPVNTNPNSIGYTAPTPIQRVATPGEVLTDTRTREEGKANRGVTMRGQNLTDARARETAARADGAAIADAGGPGQAALVKQFGKPPKDYRWKPDGSAEAIPGGPADIKAGEAGAKGAAKRDAQIAQAESVLGTIQDAKGLVGYTTAGAGGLAARVPMTDARNLQAKLETVKANLGFDRLQQMRDNSPTGGALGAVAVQELTALQSTVASLDQLQSPPQLRAALDKIEKHYTRWLDVMKQSEGGQGGASGGWGGKPAAKSGPVDFGSLK